MERSSYSKAEEYLAQYDYTYPEELVATSGAEPRESARMMVYRRNVGSIELATFATLGDAIPPGSILVLNETKVYPARFYGTLPSGKESEVTVVSYGDTTARVLMTGKPDEGDTLTTRGGAMTIVQKDGKFTTLDTHMSASDFRSFLEMHGEAPLPPYMKDITISKDDARTRYQTVFAKKEGSSAAPTASLHFSEALLTDLTARDIEIRFLTLHVGPGTFLPVIDEMLEAGKLHEEWYEIPPETCEAITRAKREGRLVIPVGTTSLRALESAADDAGAFVRPTGTTELFIRPGYRFKVADGLITNFHVPRSSLLMLVDAFIGNDTHGNPAWRTLYERAIAERFRLFSFGDGMLLL
jgi:S-adenosylmethionine:tRNA ribosyltransferase-isomerase